MGFLDRVEQLKATSGTPSQIQMGAGGQTFAPQPSDITPLPTGGFLNRVNVLRSQQPTQIQRTPLQPVQVQRTPEQTQQIIKQGVQEPEQRIVPGQKVELPEDTGFLKRALVGVGNFLFQSSPDILARNIQSGAVENLKTNIIESAQKDINSLTLRLEDAKATNNTERVNRLEKVLADTIESANANLGSDIFQKPTALQTTGALINVAANVAAPFIPAKFATTPAIGTMLKVLPGAGGEVIKAGTMRTAGGLGRAMLETGLAAAPVTAAFAGGQTLAETGSLKDAAISALIGLPAGFVFGAALPPVGKALGVFGTNVIKPTINAVDAATGGKLGSALSNVWTRGLIKPLESTLRGIGLDDLATDLKLKFTNQKLLVGQAQFNKNNALKTLDSYIKEVGEPEAMRRWNQGLHLAGINSESEGAKMLPLEELLKQTDDPIAQAAIRGTYETTAINDSIVAQYGKVYTGRTPIPTAEIPGEVGSKFVLPEGMTVLNDVEKALSDAGYKMTEMRKLVDDIGKEVGMKKVDGKLVTPWELANPQAFKTALDRELPKYKKMGEVVTKGPITKEVGEIAVDRATILYKLPKELSGAKPMYKDNKLIFENDLDKALYITGGKTKSTSHDKYVSWIKEQLPDIPDEEINRMKTIVKSDIAEMTEGKHNMTVKIYNTGAIDRKRILKDMSYEAIKARAANYNLPPKKTLDVQKVVEQATGKKPMLITEENLLEKPVGATTPSGKIKRQAQKAVPRLISPHGTTTAQEAHDLLIDTIIKNDPKISAITDPLEQKVKAEAVIYSEKGRNIDSFASRGIASSRGYDFNTVEEAMTSGWLPKNRKEYAQLLDSMIDQSAEDAAKYKSILKTVEIDPNTGMPKNPDERLKTYVSDIIKKVEINTIAKSGVKAGKESSTFIEGQLNSLLGYDKSSGLSRALAIAKQFNAAKLTTSLIANIFQPLNSLLASDLPSFAKGFKSMLHISSSPIEKYTAEEFATLAGREAGTVIEPTNIFRAKVESNAYQKFIDKLIKPFKWSEINLNRTHATNTGAFWGIDQFQKGNYAEVARYLDGESLDAAKLRGFLNDEDLIKIGSSFMDYTQFGFNPLELPTAFNNEFGSTILQFKSFGYRQLKLVINEAKLGNPRAIRNIAILALIYPPMGQAQEVLKRIVTGKALKEGLTNEDQTWLGWYMEGALNTGVMSIIGDAITSGSYGKGVSWVTGPTAGVAGGLVDVTGTLPQGDIGATADALAKYTTSQLGGAGRGAYNLGKWLWED